MVLLEIYCRQTENNHQQCSIRECVVENLDKGKEQLEDCLARKAQLAKRLRCDMAVWTITNDYQEALQHKFITSTKSIITLVIIYQQEADLEEEGRFCGYVREVNLVTLPLKQAGALLRAQQSSPAHGRSSFKRAPPSFSLGGSTASSVVNTPAEYVSNLRTSLTISDLPSSSECRHIHFNNEVEQVIAIESDEDDDKQEEIQSVFSDEEEDEDDDGGLMMRPTPSQSKSSNRSTPRGSFSEGSKTIAPLPSTTLKYRGDTPEPDKAQQLRPNSGLWSSGKILSPSPSQETLRPTRPSHNFLIDDEDEADMQWPPSGSSGTMSPYAAEDEPGPGMRRTESGMFMPYDENEEEAIVNRTLFGQALSAVYTVKDIAHVVWNVGWGK